MISAVDMRSGTKFMKDGDIYEVVEASHHKPGKGNTVMRVKERNLRTGATTDVTYRPDEKFERAYIDTKEVQYLYREGDTVFFMDTETFEQYEIPFTNIEDQMLYVVENDKVELEFHEGKAIGMVLPKSVVLTVQETQPQIKGATVTGSGKPATMETGLVVNVPDFIEVGEKLEIGTDEGDYKGRAK